MSYDLHVVRTSNWLDADTNPITKSDAELLISSDADLSWSQDFVDMKVDGEVTRFYLIEWKGNPVFWWYLNEIRFNSPDESSQVKLIEIAKALSAYVVGDDGEHYRSTPDEGGGVRVEAFQPTSVGTQSIVQAPLSPKKSWFKFW